MLEMATVDTSLQLPLPRLVAPEVDRLLVAIAGFLADRLPELSEVDQAVEELRRGLLVPPRMGSQQHPARRGRRAQ
jgi:hypothetical protein